MTMTIERPPYAGTRRFEAVPRARRAPRHRRRSGALTGVAAGAHLVCAAAGRAAARVSAEWAARMTFRVGIVAILASAVLVMFLGLAVLMTPVTPAAPVRPQFVTPSPTPFPSGWTFPPR